MTYSVVIRRVAEQDIARSHDWYAINAPEHVDRFVDDLAATVARARSHPHLFAPLRRDARRASLRIFPYHLWYRVHDDVEVIEVLGIVHDRQDPTQLTDRLA